MPEPVITSQESPPLGGVLGSTGGGTLTSPPAVAPPGPPASFVERTHAAMAAGDASLPVSPVVADPAIPAVPPAPTVEALQSQLESLRQQAIPPEQLQQMRELAQWGYQERQRQQWLAQNPTANPPGQQPVQANNPLSPHPVTGVVPFSEGDKAFLRQTAEGTIEELPGARPGLAAQWHAHVRTKADWINRLSTDPEGAMEKLFADKFAKIAETKAKEYTYQQEQDAAIKRIAADKTQWVYEHDATGNVKRDMWNNPIHTKAGETYMGFYDVLRNRGMTNQVEMDQMAELMTAGHLAMQNLQNRPQVAGQQPVPAVSPPAVPPAAPGTVLPTADQLAQQALLLQAQQRQASAPIYGINPGQVPQQNQTGSLNAFKTRVYANLAGQTAGVR